MKHAHGVIFLAVGIALVAISALLTMTQYPMWSSISLNLGLVSVAVVLVEHLWRASGGRPLEHQVASLSDQVTRLAETVDIVDASRHVGLDHVYDSLVNFGTQTDWENLLMRAEQHVDLMGRTLYGWTRSADLEDLVLMKVKKEAVKFRWLIMSSDNQHLTWLSKEKVNDGGIIKNKLNEVTKKLTNMRKKLPFELQSHLQVRVFENVPLYCSVLRIDESCFVTPYLFSASSDSSPLLIMNGIKSPWVVKYFKEFDIIWNSATDIFPTQLIGEAGKFASHSLTNQADANNLHS